MIEYWKSAALGAVIIGTFLGAIIILLVRYYEAALDRLHKDLREIDRAYTQLVGELTRERENEEVN